MEGPHPCGPSRWHSDVQQCPGKCRCCRRRIGTPGRERRCPVLARPWGCGHPRSTRPPGPEQNPPRARTPRGPSAGRALRKVRVPWHKRQPRPRPSGWPDVCPREGGCRTRTWYAQRTCAALTRECFTRGAAFQQPAGSRTHTCGRQATAETPSPSRHGGVRPRRQPCSGRALRAPPPWGFRQVQAVGSGAACGSLADCQLCPFPPLVPRPSSRCVP